MAAPAPLSRSHGPRRSILDLAPLELECMNTLWPLGEATVRQVRQALMPFCPRAYTTIMTIMDRLARKGMVTRRKMGRAYLYRPNLTAEEARAHAVMQLVEGFFAGSAEALGAHLAGKDATPARPGPARPVPVPVVDQPAAPPEELPSPHLDESLL
jgi:predicted transcriptional regulator